MIFRLWENYQQRYEKTADNNGFNVSETVTINGSQHEAASSSYSLTSAQNEDNKNAQLDTHVTREDQISAEHNSTSDIGLFLLK